MSSTNNILNAVNSYYSNYIVKNLNIPKVNSSNISNKITQISDQTTDIHFGSGVNTNTPIIPIISGVDESTTINDLVKINNLYYKTITKNYIMPTISETEQVILGDENDTTIKTRDFLFNDTYYESPNTAIRINSLMLPYIDLLSSNSISTKHIYPLAPNQNIVMGNIQVNSIEPIPPATKINITGIELSYDDITVSKLNTNQITPISPNTELQIIGDVEVGGDINPIAPSDNLNICDVNIKNNIIAPKLPYTTINISDLTLSKITAEGTGIEIIGNVGVGGDINPIAPNDNLNVCDVNIKNNIIAPKLPYTTINISDLTVDTTLNTNTINPIDAKTDILINNSIKLPTNTPIKTDIIEESTLSAGLTLKSNSKETAQFVNGTTTLYTSAGDGMFRIHTNKGTIPAGTASYDVCVISLGDNSSCYIDLEITNITDDNNIEVYKTIKIIKRTTGDITVINTIDLQKHDNWTYSAATNTIKFSNTEISGHTKQYSAVVRINLLTETSTYTITI